MTEQLPGTLAGLLRIAIDDLKKVEADSDYEIDMERWHTPITKSDGEVGCTVCMAGAVLAKSCGIRKTLLISANTLVAMGLEGDKLAAIDYLRQGDVGSAYRRVYRREPALGIYDKIFVARYGSKRFWEDMESLVGYLEGAKI